MGKMTTNTVARNQVEQDQFFLASIVEHSADAIISMTIDGHILSWNSAAERIYGYSGEEIIGRSISILVPAHNLNEMLQILERVKQGKCVEHIETMRMRKDGQPVAVSVTISPIKDVSGNIIAVSTIARDITERKRTEEALQQERNFTATVLDTTGALVVVCDRQGRMVRFNRACEQTTGYTFDEVEGKRFWDLLLIEDEVEPVKAVFEKLQAGQFPSQYENYWVSKDGRRRLIAWSNSALLDNEGSVEYIIGTGIDITGRKRAEEGLQKAHDELEERVEERTREIERRGQVAESLRDILAILNSNRPLDEILNYIVAQASWLSGSDASAIYRLQDNNRWLNIQAARGLEPDSTIEKTIPVGQGMTGQAVLKRQPVVVSDTSRYFAELVNEREGELEAQQRAFLTHMVNRYGAMLAVPLLVKDKIYGTISLYYDKPREFSEEEIRLATAVADQAALAIENARLRTQAEEAAVASERHRLARDLHDAVSQTLFSASLIAETLPRVWERYPDEAWKSLAELRQLTRGALAEMRTLLLELRPKALTEAKLDKVLGNLIEAITSRTRIPISLAVEGNCALLPDVQIALYRIAQEALNNIAKHAKASQATVSLSCEPKKVELCISDDGRGFDPKSISPHHLGVGIMHERAKAIGATLKIESQPGCGTQVVVAWEDEERGKHDE